MGVLSMKFSKGVWLMREGVTPHDALHADLYKRWCAFW
jgi:hypothetical protein